ncbi:MAG: nuclear transport factor 2 family protein [Saprospiraceae bacterium]|nr:nuclear transport factor 2 family protein [Saprospiraceae bacterium]
MKKVIFLIVCSLSLWGTVFAQGKKAEALVKGYFKAWNENKPELFNTYCTKDFSRKTGGVADSEGMNALLQQYEFSKKNMRRFKIEAKELISNKTGVAVYWTASFWPETDQVVSYNGMSMFKLENELLTEELMISDRVKMLQQMGYKMQAPESKE